MTPSMKLKIIACSLDGFFSFAVIVAILEGCFGLLNKLNCMLSTFISITFWLSEVKRLSWLLAAVIIWRASMEAEVEVVGE